MLPPIAKSHAGTRLAMSIVESIMAVLKSRDIAEGVRCDEPVVPPYEGKLYRSTWRNWFFLACVLLLTIIGLASAIPPLLSDRIVNPWPWIKTATYTSWITI